MDVNTIQPNMQIFRFLSYCYDAVVRDYVTTLKMCVPAIIYVVQNGLYYVAMSHLEPTTYCVSLPSHSFQIQNFEKFGPAFHYITGF